MPCASSRAVRLYPICPLGSELPRSWKPSRRPAAHLPTSQPSRSAPRSSTTPVEVSLCTRKTALTPAVRGGRDRDPPPRELPPTRTEAELRCSRTARQVRSNARQSIPQRPRGPCRRARKVDDRTLHRARPRAREQKHGIFRPADLLKPGPNATKGRTKLWRTVMEDGPREYLEDVRWHLCGPRGHERLFS